MENIDFPFLLNLLIGVTMLLMGQRFFWLFVGGLVYAYTTTRLTEAGYPQETVTALGIFAGIGTALLAFFLHKWALRIAGFFIGSVGLIFILQNIGYELTSYFFTFLLGGFFGVLLFSYAFDWTVMVVSAFLGASYIVNMTGIVADPSQAALATLVLAIVGTVFQAVQYRKKKGS